MESAIVIASEIPKVVENVVDQVQEIVEVVDDIIDQIPKVIETAEKVEKVVCRCFNLKISK
jgi:hypothetical protein